MSIENLQRMHSSAQIQTGAQIDPTAVIGAFTVIGADVKLDTDCRVGTHCDLGHWSNAQTSHTRTKIRIGRGVEIGSRVGIYGSVEIGNKAKIGNNVTLRGPLQIGDRSEIFDGAVIGASGQYPGLTPIGGKVVIDEDVTVREYVAINQPADSTVTRVGRHSYLMARSQIDHDCELGEHVKLASGVTLGGAVRIDDYAYLGMNCVVHQGRHVGAHVMLGMNSAILKNVPPFAVVIGPRFEKINAVGLSRRGFTQQAIDEIEAYYAERRYAYAVPESDRGLTPHLQAIADFYMQNSGEPVLSPGFSAKDE